MNRNIAGELAIYAPVSVPGPYVWPVTERGIAHSSTMGDAAPIVQEFRAQFKPGTSLALLTQDIQLILQNMDVIPKGFIAPDCALLRIEDWKMRRKNEYVQVFSSAGEIRCSSGKIVAVQDKSVLRSLGGIRKTAQWYVASQKMRKLATTVAWKLAAPWTSDPNSPEYIPETNRIIRLEMLKIAASAIQRLQEHPSSAPTALPISHTPEEKEQVLNSDTPLSISQESTGLTTLEKQIRAIEAAADEKGMSRTDIPRGGKKALQKVCEEKKYDDDLFTAGDTRFETAWKAASTANRIIIRNRIGYRGGK